MGEMSKTNMDRHRSYRIGLDIGIASVGWAVLENNSQDEPIRIARFRVPADGDKGNYAGVSESTDCWRTG